MNKARTGHAGSTAVLSWLAVMLSYSVLLLDTHRLVALGVEDGPVETTGAVLFGIASLLFFAGWWISDGRDSRIGFRTGKRNLVYLLLAVLMFACAGEEISWGQRIIGWDTPEEWSALSAQNETNLHNLRIFHDRDPDTIRQSHPVLNLNRLFALFSLGLFLGLPLLLRWNPAAEAAAQRIGMPVPPLWLGVLFLAHLVFTTQFLLRHPDFAPPALPRTVHEFKETVYALIWAVYAWLAWQKQRRPS